VEGEDYLIREASYYGNMARGMFRLLRHHPMTDRSEALRDQMANRESRFLENARTMVFANPRNPYHSMFRLAGCEWKDLGESVTKRGLESTLEQLACEGVFLTHDEFKGKTPLVRSGRHIELAPETLLNPRNRGGMETMSGGSRSLGTKTRKSLELQLYRDVYDQLLTREFDLERRTRILVLPILPSSVGLGNSIRRARAGERIDKWFSVRGTLRDSGHYRALTNALVVLGRSMGASLPWPTYLPPNDFLPAARWIAGRKREGRPCAVRSYVSPAVRIADAARSAGLDISGTLFFVAGEALTEAKRATIEETGAEVYPGYGITEVGSVGVACRQMRQGNCVHLFSDQLAVVNRVRRAPLSGEQVNSLLFTNLLPSAPRFLINAEMDDSGVIEPAVCDCEYSRAGMTMQIRNIFSYGKLTGQGVTLFGTDVVRILEAALPRRFGGAPGDYQLVEREAGRQTELILRVSPRVAAATDDVREAFLNEVRGCYGGTLAARLWNHSAGLTVVSAEPVTTRSGKVLPLHILGAEARHAHAS